MQKMPIRTLLLFVPYALFSVVHLIALMLDFDSVSTFTKWLLMPFLLLALLFALPRWRGLLALLATLGILFSWAGDVGIAAPGETNFLIALGFFLIAHIFYIVLFWRHIRVSRISGGSAIYVLWWIALVIILAPHTGALLLPVAAYGLVLGAMGAIALSCNRLIAVGGALFVVSDTVLGLNKFLPGFELWQVDFLIMLTYVAAQGLIALGILHRARQLSGGSRQAPEGATLET